MQMLKLQKKAQKAEREAAKLRWKKDTGDRKLAVQRREAAMKLENTGMVNDTASSANPILAKPFDAGTSSAVAYARSRLLGHRRSHER